MGKCTIIGKIRVPSNVGQAVRVNGKKCDEETVWTVTDVYGGESIVTNFTIENKSNVTFDIEGEITSATASEYTAQVLLSDGVTPVTFPFTLVGKATENWQLKITFDKYIAEGSYEVIFEVDFV